jgi:hypothetical protein
VSQLEAEIKSVAESLRAMPLATSNAPYNVVEHAEIIARVAVASAEKYRLTRGDAGAFL